MNKTAETLRGALKLLKHVGWTQGHYARSASGGPVATRSPEAVCFCALGAILATNPKSASIRAAELALEAVLPDGFSAISQYNDDPRCEFRHVRALFGKAILKLEVG